MIDVVWPSIRIKLLFPSEIIMQYSWQNTHYKNYCSYSVQYPAGNGAGGFFAGWRFPVKETFILGTLKIIIFSLDLGGGGFCGLACRM